MSDKKENDKKRVFSIEKAMASGVDKFVEAMIDGFLDLNKKDIRMYSDLANEPFFSEDVENEMYLSRFKGGFFAKHMEKAWFKFTSAFQSIWHSKRVRKALEKANRSTLGDW